jgi:hypothetical protein
MKKVALRGHVSSVESARSEGDDWFGSGRSTENRSSVSGSHSIAFHVADMIGTVGRSLDAGDVKPQLQVQTADRTRVAIRQAMQTCR